LLRKTEEATMLPEFDLLMPQTLPEALDMLDSTLGIVPIAGGTNVIVELREGRHRNGTLMDVSRLTELRGVRRENGYVVLGGGATIAALLADPLIAAHGAPLRQAATTLGSPLVRNRATVAGNLVDASPAADTAPPLLALGAEVELASQAGTRRVPLHEFFLGPNQTVRRPDELLVAVRWPVPPANSAGAFRKLGLRNALACSIITVAVAVERGETGGCENVRIALGSVAPTPIRAVAAEDALRGQPLTVESIAEAARLAAEATRPIDDIRGTAAYRKRMAAVLVRRLLEGVQR
jgi:CO/xanthine dehydrogenase FAD-binding subunit